MAIGQKLEEARNRRGYPYRLESTKFAELLEPFGVGNFDINLPEVYLRDLFGFTLDTST